MDLELATPFYAALFALFFIYLSFRTIRLRRLHSVAIGDGADPQLARAARVHGNFAEYVPLTLLLLFFLEATADIGNWVHVLCLLLLTGRVLHAFGVSQAEENYRYRQAGMAMTFITMLVVSIWLLYAYLA